ncbi:2-C-methyl-D-erythritol 2,4-cyclodiphosphate synthase [Myxococcota bacterium]|nr:2-C-methyl-D-erythritol 2,4-cyclodiphosphate synthase [Myxococcota bacterium]
MRIGQGFDVHRLVAGRPLFLGGIEVPHDRGLEGHSDGDAVLHAAADALLGALGQGDLGRHFPSSDASLAGIASREILGRVGARLEAERLVVSHLDVTIIAQEPRLGGYLSQMEAVLSEVLATDVSRVNVKVTSTDGLGSIGRGEGIAALASVLLVAP